MIEDDTISPCTMILILIITLCVTYYHQTDLDEYGRDSYDRYRNIHGRDSWGNIINEGGTYSIWDNLIDDNPFYSY